MKPKTKKDKAPEPRVVDTNDVPQRLYVKFRVGFFYEEDTPDGLLDDVRADLADEMALAVQKVLCNKKYADLLCDKEMKVSHEMTEWLDF